MSQSNNGLFPVVPGILELFGIITEFKNQLKRNYVTNVFWDSDRLEFFLILLGKLYVIVI